MAVIRRHRRNKEKGEKAKKSYARSRKVRAFVPIRRDPSKSDKRNRRRDRDGETRAPGVRAPRSALLALHPPRPSLPLLVVAVVGAPTTSVLLAELPKVYRLGGVRFYSLGVVRRQRLGARQHFAKLGQLRLAQGPGRGERDAEVNEELPLLKGGPLLGHALVVHALHKRLALARVGAEHLPRFGGDQQLPPVQVRHQKRVPAKRFLQRHLFADQQVVVLARENAVLLFLQHEQNVPRLRVGHLVRHAPKPNLLVVLHPALDVHLQHLALFLFFHGEPRGPAGGALLLDLLHHPGPNLPHAHNHAPPVALPALLRLAHDFVPGHREFRRFAVVQVL
mmetsp:Transcript_4069/g.7606  ORF Transcript_4069/g.7606 Transcript_4069/m.7606 type:complete len:336 (-) Transcript_4069:484-1491(-)